MRNPFRRRKPATPPPTPGPETEDPAPTIYPGGYWGHEQGTGLYDDDYGIMR